MRAETRASTGLEERRDGFRAKGNEATNLHGCLVAKDSLHEMQNDAGGTQVMSKFRNLRQSMSPSRSTTVMMFKDSKE